jgi:hypothetical protein
MPFYWEEGRGFSDNANFVGLPESLDTEITEKSLKKLCGLMFGSATLKRGDIQ